MPVAERLQQMEDLAADAVSGLRYIEQTHGQLYGVGWDRVYKKADRLQLGHALPLPEEKTQKPLTKPEFPPPQIIQEGFL